MQPRQGHPTYVFAKPRSMDGFLSHTPKAMKDDIRHNRNNAAERLGFIGHVVHGDNSRTWLKEIRQRIGKGIDFDSTASSKVVLWISTWSSNFPGAAKIKDLAGPDRC
jgi:hypothetical protein